MYKTLKDYLDILVLKGYINDTINTIELNYNTTAESKDKVVLILQNISVNKRKKIANYECYYLNNQSCPSYLLYMPINSAELYFTKLDKNYKYKSFFNSDKDEYVKKLKIKFPELKLMEVDKYTSGGITPSVQWINEEMLCSLESYKDGKFYTYGSYCMYGKKIYKCISKTRIKGNFDRSQWKESPLVKCIIRMHASYLPISYLNNEIRDFFIFNPATYDSLMTLGNSVISYNNFENLMDYISENRNALYKSYKYKRGSGTKSNDHELACRMIEKALNMPANSITVKETNISDVTKYYVVETVGKIHS